MPSVETLNAWGANWSVAMSRSLVDASLLLGLVLIVWLPFWRRVPSHAACVLFLLVLLKAALPFPVPLPEAVARLAPAQAFDRFVSRKATPRPAPEMPRALPPPVQPANLPEVIAREWTPSTPGPGPGDLAGAPWSGNTGLAPARQTGQVELPAVEKPATPALTFTALAMLAWAVVVVGLGGRFACVHWIMSRRLRGARRLEPDTLPVNFRRLCARCGLRGDVPLRVTPSVDSPAVWGLWRPVVLVPPGLAETLPPAQLTWVLLHELIHIRRRDPWVVAFQRLVQIVYVFHPAVWVANRLLDVHREFACDDAALALALADDVPRRECGAGFLAVIERACTPSPTVSPALSLFGSHTVLRRRLMRILDTRRLSTGRLSLRVWLVLTALAVVALPYVRARGPEESSPGGSATAPAVTRNDEPVSDPGTALTLPETKPHVFHLRVVAAGTNAPVADADVRIWVGFRDEWRKTDAQGRLDITHSTGPSDRGLWVDVWGNGLALQRHRWGDDPNRPIPEGATVALQPGETLGGLVQDEAGRPIAGATVYLFSHNYKRKDPHEFLNDLRAVTGPDGRWSTSGAPETTGELLGFRLIHPDYLSHRDYGDKDAIPKIADLRAGKAVSVLKKGVPIEGRVVDHEGHPVAGARVVSAEHPSFPYSSLAPFEVTTGSDGHFRTWQVKAGEWHLLAQASGHGPGARSVTVGAAVPQVEVVLGKPRVFKGRVLDPGGKPVAGALVGANDWHGFQSLGTPLWTDADGRFRWDDAPGDAMTVNVTATGYLALLYQRIDPSDPDVVFTLRPSISIHGRVTDAQTKKRIDDATVEYSAVDPKSGEPSRWESLPEASAGVAVYQGLLNVDVPVTGDAPAYKLRVRSPGYLPLISRAFRRNEKVVRDYDIALVSGTAAPAGTVATVVRPGGKPLVGTRLFEFRTGGTLTIDDGVAHVNQGNRCREDRTGPEGTFAIPHPEGSWFVFILGDDAYAVADNESVGKSPRVVAKPLSRIEGEYRIGSRVVAGAALELNGALRGGTNGASVFIRQTTRADAQGRFAFKDVVAGSDPRIGPDSRGTGPGGGWSIGEPVSVEPGATARVQIGGKGRPIVGRVEPPEDWRTPVDFTREAEAHLETNRTWTPFPLSLFRGKTSLGAEWNEWLYRWPASPEGRAYERQRVAVRVALAPDGSFRFDDVPPGEYRLALRVNGLDQFHVQATHGRDPGPFGRIVRMITVPPVSGGQSDEPLDLGVLRLRPRRAPQPGEPAPVFEITTTGSKKLAVPGAFRGKFLLIDFATLWDQQSRIQITRLNDVYRKFGNDPRFALLSLTFDADRPETRKFIEEKGEPWTQAIVGPLSNAISLDYGVDDENVPATILIGPDGKIVARDLWYNKISTAVGEALASSHK
jgi:beta-lactamase regulating signal transducer with metallopeptidase domain